MNRYIVMGDDILGRDIENDNTKVNPDHLLNKGDQYDEPRPFNTGKASKCEDHTTLIFA